MAKFQSPLLGYNNNVRHRGRIFHIQTEDSGINHPHIITHLFMDGGRILKSVKKSYAEHVGSDGLSETVRVLMKEQHKAMFIALRDGQFDDLVEGTKKPSGQVVAPTTTKAPPPTAVESAKKNATAAKVAIEAAADSRARAAAAAVATAAAEEAKAVPDAATKADPPKAADAKAAEAQAAEAKPDTKPEAKSEAKPAALDAPAAPPPRKHPPPKIDLSKIERPKTESKIDAAAVEAAAAKAAAATAKVLADEEPAFLTELAKAPEVAILTSSIEATGATSLIGSGPATHQDPPRVSEEMPPNTLTDEEIDLDNLPLPSDSDEVMVVDIDDDPVPAPPPPPSVRIPSPQSTTDPSAVLERAPTVAAMPASGGPKAPPPVMMVDPQPPPPSTIDENPNTMRDPERQERRRQSAEELTLDFDALERDSQHSDQVSAHFQTTDLPPPPKNLFASKERTGSSTGAYSAVVDDELPPSRPQPNTARSGQNPPIPSAAAAAAVAPPKPSQKPGSEGRYAPARPAAIFGASPGSGGASAKPPPPAVQAPTNSSLFNDDLVSDKSLDEVILSYLAEDLDPPRRK